MIIIKNKILPFSHYKCMNFFGILFTKTKELSDEVINHERIHSAQIFELAVLGETIAIILFMILDFSAWWILFGCTLFYILYGLEYIFTYILNKNNHDAYHDISFEEEAYNNQSDLLYLSLKRKDFAWLKYIKLGSYKNKKRR